MCDRRTLVWLPLASMTMLVVLSGQDCLKINKDPIANAGPTQEVCLGDGVFLDGTASYDPDGDSLSYHWQRVRGPAQIVLEGAETATPSFVPPATGEYELSLTVSDSKGASDEDTVVVSVSDGPQCPGRCVPPIAYANTPVNPVCEGNQVSLMGSASVDPKGRSLSGSWRQTGGPFVQIQNPFMLDTGFVAPEVTANVEMVFELTVSNGCASDIVSLSITVMDCTVVPPPPIANAGVDQTVNTGSGVVLDGSASTDPNNLALTYLWSQISGQPTVALSNPQVAKPTFTAPQAQTILTFQLTVSNGSSTATDTVVVAVGDDPDGDGVQSNADNCPAVANSNQANADGDAAGDACDGCVNDPNKTAPGQCGCGIPDTDADADGVADCNDQCPNTPAGQTVDANGCAASQKDSDNDGVKDNVDQCPNTPVGQAVDAQGCPLSTGPMAWWRMEDKQGSTIPDASGSGHTGAIEGSPTFTGAVVSFNQNGAIYTPDRDDLDLLGDFTITFWLKTSEIETPCLWKHKEYQGIDGGYAIGAGTGRIYLVLYNATFNSPKVQWEGSLSASEWHLVSVAFAKTGPASGTVSIYADGVLRLSQPGPYVIKNNAYPLAIGGVLNQSNGWLYLTRGQMGDLRIYDRVLSASEITDLYQGHGPGPDSDGDGWADSADNCPNVANPSQADTNGNGVGDVCEPAPSSVQLRSGSSLNGQTVDQCNHWITVSPGQSITGTVKVTTSNTMDAGAVAPLGYTVTWGNRTSQPVLSNSWIATGTQQYDVSVNKTAPTTPGDYFIIIAFAGRYDIGQVFSSTTAGATAVWNDGNDYGWDWTEAQYQQARESGTVTVPVWMPPSFNNYPMAATWVGVRVQEQTPNSVRLRSGGSLNGQTVDQCNYWITASPGQSITGTVKVTTNNVMDGGAVAPLGYTVTWGDRTSQPVLSNSWIATGTQQYDISVNKTAPSTPGNYYIIIAFAGRYNISQVFSSTTAGATAVWYDGNDYGWDWSLSQYQQARGLGTVIVPVWLPPNFANYPMGATWVGVQVQ